MSANASPALTIGMATYDDFHGVYFSVQAMRLYHDLTSVELIVVDNNPAGQHGQNVERLIESWCSTGNAGARYIPMPDAVGTTQPRNRVFQEARGEAVMCIDSHVLLWPGSVARLIEYFREHPDCQNLLHGPLVYDSLFGDQLSTHFNDEWRKEMWGTWGQDPRGRDIDSEPFEIPGQGLGLFACRKDAWLGFNEHFRAFGGEEMYIHEKYRQAGRKVLCLPFLRWVHRFGRPEGRVPYPLTRWHKVRNYVLGHLELGLPLDRVYEHFVTSGLIGQLDWDYLVEEPVAHENPRRPNHLPQMPMPQGQQPQQDLDAIYSYVKQQPRDLDQHADWIRHLASQSQHVTALVTRREWNVFLAAGRPDTLIAYQVEDDPLLKVIHAAIEAQPKGGKRLNRYTTTVGPGADSLAIPPIEQTDLLCIDTVHTGERLLAELERHGPRVTSRILIHDTEAFGRKAEGADAPGLWFGIQAWLDKNTEWFVAAHQRHQYGMTLLSRRPEDKPKQPITPWPPNKGPGTELHAMLAAMGINPSASCDCRAKAEQMDRWGVQGSRENRETIINWLKEGQDRWGWTSKFGAATKAIWSGLALKINPLDPIPSLVDEAIRRAEKREREDAAA